MYKPSNYSYIWPLEESNNLLIFNSLTTRLAEIPSIFKNLLESKQIDLSGLSAEQKNMINELKKDGFLIDEWVDELKIIKYVSASQKYSKDGLSLTIAPTLDCNFRCTYCYQGEKSTGIMMPEEVQNAIVEYISKQAKRVERIGIVWFGGEPLLAKDIIYRLSSEINDLAKKNDCIITYSMITNGSLFDNDSIYRLKNYGVKNIQITLDGPPDIHNKRRTMIEKGEPRDSFGIIVSNIKELLKNEMNVHIRVNIDIENMHSTEEFLDILVSSGIKNLNIHPAQVSPYTDACKSVEGACLNNKQFAEVGSKFYELLIEKGFITDYSSIYPERKAIYCGASHINSYSIDPDGLIYKCWSDFGSFENNLGNIMDLSKGKNLKASHISWLTWDPFDFNQCRKCKFLPLCMGGCPHNGMKLNGGRPECSEIRHYLEAIIKNHYKCIKIKEYCKKVLEQAPRV